MGLNDIKTYLIGLVIFVVIVFAGVFTIGSFKVANPSMDSSRVTAFNSTFYAADNVTNAVNGIGQSLENTGDKPGALGWFNVLFGSSWQGLKALSSSLGFFKGILVATGNIFGIPPAIAGLISLFIIIIIVFAIWGVIIQAQD